MANAPGWELLGRKHGRFELAWQVKALLSPSPLTKFTGSAKRGYSNFQGGLKLLD